MAEVLLDVALVDLGRGGAQRVASEFLLALALRQVAAHAGRERQALDEARDMAVVELLWSDLAPRDRPEYRPAVDAREFSARSRAPATGQLRSLEPRPISTSRQPVLPRSVRSTPSSKNSGQPEPSSESSGLMTRPTISAAQAAGEAEEEDRPVAEIAEVGRGQGVEHGNGVLGQERLFLDRRPAMGAADAGEHGRDMAVLAVEGQGPLGETPPECREPPLDGGDRARPAARALGARGQRREIKADAFAVGERARVEPLAGAPAQVVAPVGGVCAVGGLRGRRARVGAAGLDQRLELCRQGTWRPAVRVRAGQGASSRSSLIRWIFARGWR
jgi:hypothetical protein